MNRTLWHVVKTGKQQRSKRVLGQSGPDRRQGHGLLFSRRLRSAVAKQCQSGASIPRRPNIGRPKAAQLGRPASRYSPRTRGLAVPGGDDRRIKTDGSATIASGRAASPCISTVVLLRSWVPRDEEPTKSRQAKLSTTRFVAIEKPSEISWAACGERSNAADAAEFNGAAPKLPRRCSMVPRWWNLALLLLGAEQPWAALGQQIWTTPDMAALSPSQTLDRARRRLLEWLVITEDQGRSLGRRVGMSSKAPGRHGDKGMEKY
ncbi:hypothetical protein CPLU01_06191 [Colletotrichum plurivorum]|uniref:Uncharacterized protein n=1 Tax=Colletotrichum plurivorum TaxID=2175906 RepID=A0A8H6NH86_9PEZI|nr:hypothetical protein CPLU01_06191 [Colletotrichum plurivorum]